MFAPQPTSLILQAETWTLNVKSVVDNVRRGVDTSASVFDWPLEPSYSTSNTEMLEKKGRHQFSDDPDDEVVGRVGRETSLLDTHRPNPKDVRNLNAPADKLEAHAKEQLMEIRRASSLAALPAFSQDMGCFLIKLEDLELEAKPFASGGSGRVCIILSMRWRHTQDSEQCLHLVYNNISMIACD